MTMDQFFIVLGCVLGSWAGFFTREGVQFTFLDASLLDCAFTMTSLTLVSTYSISPTQTRAFDLMTRYTMITHPPTGFLSRSEYPAVFSWINTTRSRTRLLFPVTFVPPLGSRRIHFLEDSTWGSIDPRDHARDRVFSRLRLRGCSWHKDASARLCKRLRSFV